jgi:hypothetical protein
MDSPEDRGEVASACATLSFFQSSLRKTLDQQFTVI